MKKVLMFFVIFISFSMNIFAEKKNDYKLRTIKNF